ncbi:MAG: hypothetical protein WAM05_16365 [Candidatus Binataceae bacterium]
MAELFSLIPDSTSCNDRSVEASRTPLRPTLPISLHADAFATWRNHQSNHQPTTAQRTDSFPRAARGNESSSCLGVLVFLSAFVFSLFRGLKRVQKSMTEKAAETNPLRQIQQHFQGVYFSSH